MVKRKKSRKDTWMNPTSINSMTAGLKKVVKPKTIF